jgi:mono/diheme cytochrome c family protein
MRSPLPWLAVLLVGLLPGSVSAAPVDFRREVAPILAENCFQCHGPDDGVRKGKLRLDQRDAALRGGRSEEPAIVPNQPDKSEIIRRLTTDEPDRAMPPAQTGKKLTAKQIDTLRRWIAEGAEYKVHWSFVAPTRPPLPAVKETWGHNGIDRFVLARLEAEGLKPSPPADPLSLIRRLHLDLTGIPPTPEEADAFVEAARRNPQSAIEEAVDRLLASPAYGERWARRWLDLARYADTNGYEKDRPRSIWPYRDWVINALNADMPFDRFTIEQLAGDLLPGATISQRIATGFHRNTMLNEEGGIDPLEFRFHAMTDRLATTGTVWLGLTIGCAQCHSHKYDPIPHREYYRMFAFLNNADEPEMPIPTPELTARRHEIESKIAALEANLGKKFPANVDAEKLFSAWMEKQRQRAIEWTVRRPTEAKGNVPSLTILPDASVLASGDTTKRDVYTLTLRGDFAGVTALRLEALPDPSLPKNGPGRVYYEGPFGDFQLSEITATADGKPVKFASASQSYANGNSKAAQAIDGDPQSGWSVNGGQGKRHVAVFVFATPLPAVKELHVEMVCERYYASGLGRFRLATTTASKPEASDLPAEVESLFFRLTDWTDAERTLLHREFLLRTPELAPARQEIENLRKQLPAYPTTLVMQERPAGYTRQTFRHHRGEFLQPKEAVEPGILSVLPPLPEGATPDRLGFARWLVSRNNPLTARVTVNRQWAALFGRGIVKTTEDFGLQGDAPTHPELLDWLAIEFMENGWSLKKLHRLIVLSATYQQASRVTPELLARDAENRLLARGPRVRLEAELIRDSVLHATGLLSRKQGGPSVFPPQPANVTTEGNYGAFPWTPSQGADRYRRGLYTFSKRTTPFAMLSIFDGPSGEACIARRDVSNTPLQALTLLNDVVFTEAAQAMGRQLAARQGSVEERVQFVFRRFLTRPATAAEATALVNFFTTQKERFGQHPDDAKKLAGDGPGDVAERAAWTALARVLMNLDEFVTRN